MASVDMNLIALLRGILGIVVILGLAFLLSESKRKINWRLVLNQAPFHSLVAGAGFEGDKGY